jgi:voltage-gated potassium channel
VTQSLATLHARFSARRHTALLIAIVSAFAARPLMGDSEIVPLVFSVLMLVLMLVALYTIQVDDLVGEREVLLAQRRRRSIVGWMLAVPATIERLYVILVPSSRLFVVSSICWLLFLAFVTWSQLRSLLKQKEVTGETISMSISVYLLLGLTWGMVYILIFQLHPEAFSFGASPTPTLSPDRQQIFPIFVYFSLTTLSTLGFGDILPLTLPARYAAVAEGITGQFYLAIMVARLVGMQMARSVAQGTGNHPRGRDTEDSVDRGR